MKSIFVVFSVFCMGVALSCNNSQQHTFEDAGARDGAEGGIGAVDLETSREGSVDRSAADQGGVTSSGPVILYTDIVAGPKTGTNDGPGGSYLSIFGKNFGADLVAVTVHVGDGEVGAYKYLGPSKGRPDIQQLSVQLGSACTTGPIRVAVNGKTSNTDHLFTVRPGDIFFMSRSGDNETGVPNDSLHPYRHASYVTELAEFDVGDFLVIRQGNYDLSSGEEGLAFSGSRWINIGVNNKSGASASEAITVYGYPGEEVVVDWGSDTGAEVAGIRCAWGAAHWTFANLEFDLKDSGAVAIYLGFYADPTAFLNHARLVNIDVRGGMAGATFGVNTLSLQSVDNLKMYGVSVGNQSSLADPGLESHMVYLSHEYKNSEIGWCYIHDNPHGRAAFQVHSDTGEDNDNVNVRIHDTTFKNLPKECLLLGIGSKEIFIYNNVFEACNTKHAGMSSLALRGAGQNKGAYHLYNNTIYTDAKCNGTDGYSSSSAGGILQLGYMIGQDSGTYPEHIELFNNLILPRSPETNYWSVVRASGAPGFDPKTQVTADHNLWYGATQAIPDWAGAHHLASQPLLLDPTQGDFRPASIVSPTVDKGTSSVSGMVARDHHGILRPQGSEYDVGAHEYHGDD